MKSVASDENQDKIEKQIMRELKILRMCRSPYIVTFYGAFMHNEDISIMMEYMDLGTLDSVYQKTGPIPEKCVAKITSQLLQGLIYLYEHHKIVHRGISSSLDIKPSNILLCSSGYAKIADFGVSKETAETLAMTFIGTQCFLAPERIKMNAPCSPASDVWALGLSMMEIAMAKFPFPSEAMGSYFDMMEYIIQQPSPTLPAGVFSSHFEEYCKLSLIKDPAQRPHPQKLIVRFTN
jgi:serine/threonine protein kinase